jgi:FkbM family methyltransferase
MDYLKAFESYVDDGEYFETIINRIMYCYVRPGDVIVDGGANCGRHAFPLAEMVGPRGMVYAAEPLPHHAQSLRGKSPQLRVIDAALTDFDGDTTFQHCTNDDGLSATVAYEEQFALKQFYKTLCYESLTVAARKLDSVIPTGQTVRLVKLDLEGGEFAALRGARRILERDKPLVIFEHGVSAAARYQFNRADYRAFWTDLGYRVVDLFGKSREGDAFDDFSDTAVWYLVAGASNDAVRLIKNIHIPVTMAAQMMDRRLVIGPQLETDLERGSALVRPSAGVDP